MNKCTEFAVFQVEKDNVSRAIELSETIFLEMNESEQVIISSNILVKTDNPEEICWHLEWISEKQPKKRQKSTVIPKYKGVSRYSCQRHILWSFRR